MPSFRITLTIGTLRPGVDPATVVPTAADAARALTTVEAADLTLVARVPRVVVRFTAEDAELALQIAGRVAAVTGTIAEVNSWRVTERVHGDWVGV